MSAILGSIWPAVAGFIVALAGVIFGLFRHQQAKTASAQAAQQVAEAQTKVEQANASEAQSNAQAAQAGAQAAQERTNVENDTAALPAGDAAQQLRDHWTNN